MDKSKIVNCILDILKTNNLQRNGIEIDKNTSLYDEYGINSIGIIELIVRIEEHFNFELNDTELVLSDFETISKIADIVSARIDN